MQTNKQKGYVLAVVMLLSLLMSITIVSTFTIVYRYAKMTERTIEDLREDVYLASLTEETLDD